MQEAARAMRKDGFGLVTLRKGKDEVARRLPLGEGRFGSTTHYICIQDTGAMLVFAAKYLKLVEGKGFIVDPAELLPESLAPQPEGIRAGKSLPAAPHNVTYSYDVSESCGSGKVLLGRVSLITEISGRDSNHSVLQIAPSSSHGMDVLRPIADEALAFAETTMKESFQPPILGIDHFSFEDVKMFLPRNRS